VLYTIVRTHFILGSTYIYRYALNETRNEGKKEQSYKILKKGLLKDGREKQDHYIVPHCYLHMQDVTISTWVS
jgi:hypothetical protein